MPWVRGPIPLLVIDDRRDAALGSPADCEAGDGDDPLRFLAYTPLGHIAALDCSWINNPGNSTCFRVGMDLTCRCLFPHRQTA